MNVQTDKIVPILIVPLFLFPPVSCKMKMKMIFSENLAPNAQVVNKVSCHLTWFVELGQKYFTWIASSALLVESYCPRVKNCIYWTKIGSSVKKTSCHPDIMVSFGDTHTHSYQICILYLLTCSRETRKMTQEHSYFIQTFDIHNFCHLKSLSPHTLDSSKWVKEFALERVSMTQTTTSGKYSLLTRESERNRLLSTVVDLTLNEWLSSSDGGRNLRKRESGKNYHVWIVFTRPTLTYCQNCTFPMASE